MIFRAGPALGAVLMGSLSEHFGLRLPLAVGALVSCGFWVLTRFKQRRIAETLEADPVRCRRHCRRRPGRRHDGPTSVLLRPRLHARGRWRVGSPPRAGPSPAPAEPPTGRSAARAGFAVDLRPRPPAAAASVATASPISSSRSRRTRPATRCSRCTATTSPRSQAPALARLSVDDRRLRRPRRRLGRRDRRAVAERRARPPPGRGRSGLARSVASARRAGAHLPPRRHLRARPQRLRRTARRHARAHRQAGPGVLAHPCRRHRRRAARLDRRGRGPARSTMSATTSRRRRRPSSPMPRRLLGMPPPPLVPLADAELSPMARSFYDDNKRVSNALIKSELGVALPYPDYRAGLAAILADGGLPKAPASGIVRLQTHPAGRKCDGAYNVLMMGASYGSLLATKLLFGGHKITMVCLPERGRGVQQRRRACADADPRPRDPDRSRLAQTAGQARGRRHRRRQPQGLRPRRAGDAGAAIPLARRARAARRGGARQGAVHVDHEHAAAALSARIPGLNDRRAEGLLYRRDASGTISSPAS